MSTERSSEEVIDSMLPFYVSFHHRLRTTRLAIILGTAHILAWAALGWGAIFCGVCWKRQPDRRFVPIGLAFSLVSTGEPGLNVGQLASRLSFLRGSRKSVELIKEGGPGRLSASTYFSPSSNFRYIVNSTIKLI